MSDRPPFVAEGTPNERTALAWQRTALSLLAGSAALSRFTVGDLGFAAVAALLVAAALSGWIMLESRGRYAHDAGTRLRSRPRGGRAPAALAVATAILALTQLAALLISEN